MSRFTNQTVVVTGGANGIGQACAIKFASEGAHVAILDIEGDALKETADQIRASGGRCHTITADLSKADVITQSFAEIAKTMGPVDILINNVGQAARERASQFWCSDPKVWDFVLGVTLYPMLRSTREVVPIMRERKRGKVISIASDTPFVGDPNTADYATAKGGIIALTRTLATELGPFNINVNAVCPGLTNTRGPKKMPADMMNKIKASIPLGVIAEPSDIANGVAFLASEDARMITGQLLVINGGRAYY